jgi:hypothetical protein
MYIIELDSQTEDKLVLLARLEGKEPSAWIRDKLVGLIQSQERTRESLDLPTLAQKRIGVAKGFFDVPDDIDADNGVIADLFNVDAK